MQQQLTNLSDKELISRARKQHDREAEGVLMDRYSHLLVAVTLPHLSQQSNLDPNVVFPSLLQRLSASLKTQTIYKVNEWILHIQKGYLSKPEKNTPFYPSRDGRDLLHIENTVDKAATNIIDRQDLIVRLEQALQRLNADDRALITQFYLENKPFADLSATTGISREKLRTQLKAAKGKLAKLFMNGYVK
ncbi:sigma-70 family RNA polymerase sigma factor [Chitinophaga polysaccharea]|uniref:RNA polymerase sigma factor n=1 Tax=Chitinophaga TaxID=79328 RepID=UPI001455D343|nr:MULTISPECIES: sigma-70 family RNA polymerase sigma factor [Chitinophaga]NLR58534.1 sigma-70 family RNA polymerase sigma factor [Chitinophaga polysaccharea]NLU91062.1 sigma-70 family RNA polymerase sigma factor [Chitinophaga sp. Ak27]